MKILASSTEKFKEIEEVVLSLGDFAKKFNRAEESINCIKFISDYSCFNNQEVFWLHDDLTINKIWLDTHENYEKSSDGKFNQQLKYSISVLTTLNKKTVVFEFNGLYVPNFSFRFPVKEASQ